MDKLFEMRLSAMSDAFLIQMNDPQMQEVTFEDHFEMLVVHYLLFIFPKRTWYVLLAPGGKGQKGCFLLLTLTILMNHEMRKDISNDNNS